MRKIFILLFTIIVFKSYGQDPIQTISKNYFRTHPFDSKFSTFILNLQKDPWLTIEEFSRRTDSTFFYVNGIYKNFNPFRFTPSELRLIIAEEEIIYTDSLQTHDTIINLQLIGVVDSNASNIKLVEKEFNRFHQSHSKRFNDFAYKKAIKSGEIYNYFVAPFTVSPVTIAWGIMPETRQFGFALTIRFKVIENQAVYITQPGELKGL